MAFVAPQLVPIPFTGGIDTKTDSKQVLAGHLLELENGVFSKGGAINKRFGYDVLSQKIEGGGTIDEARALSSFDSELLLFDGSLVYSYIEATQRWQSRGTAVSIIATDDTIVRASGTQQLNPDVAYLAGVEVYAWEDSTGGVRYSVVDSATRAFVISNALVDVAGAKPKAIAFAGQIRILFTDGVNSLFYRSVNPMNPTVIGTKTALKTDMFAASSYDATVIGSKLFVGYLSTSTVTGAITLLTFDASLSLVGTAVAEATSGLAHTGGTQMAVNVVGTAAQTCWISWSSGIAVRSALFSYALVPILADTSVAAVVALSLTGVESPTVPGALVLCYEVTAGAVGNHLVGVSAVTTGGSVSAAPSIRGVGLASKMFASDGAIYVNVTRSSTLQCTYFTMLIGTAQKVVAKTQAGVGAGLRSNNMLSEVPALATGVFLWANGVKGKSISEAQTFFSLIGVSSTRLDFAHPNRFISAVESRNLMYVGGILSSYDGVAAAEQNFHLYPEGFTATPAGSDGSLSTGAYQYAITYEWTDNLGQVQRSAPSVPLGVSVTSTNHVTLVIPTLRLTAKLGTISIVIYRTAADGVLFNRVTSTLAPLANDATADTVTFVDKASDVSIAANELLYTTGNVLANSAPPACSIAVVWQGRVILGGLEDPNLLWFSKNKFDNTNANTIPVEFAPELTIGCATTGGPITALAVLDDKLVIFKATDVFAVSGDGPNDTGGGTSFPDPQYVTADVGCANPNSVVSTPVGLMFQSAKGIYLLDRSLSATFIGAPVDAFRGLEIASATLNQDVNQVVFTTSGPALVYDYYFQQWSTFTNHESAEDSDTFGGSFVFAKSDGRVYLQNRDEYTDGGVAIALAFTTPNLSFAQLNGFQRVFSCFILGTYGSPHSLNVAVAYDYQDTYSEAATIDANDEVSTWGSDETWGASDVWGGGYKPYEFRVDFGRQRCTAIRLRVSDSQASDYGEGYAISALTFNVGVLPGGQRLPVASQVGSA